MSKITQKELKEVLHYDKDSGVFTWKVSRGTAKKGSIAGSISAKGYMQIRYKKNQLLGHRIAWLYEYGYVPKIIDHINQVRSDNRIDNLREVSKSGNSRNCTKSSINTSGVTGVHWDKSKSRWRACMRIDGKLLHFGYHAEFSDAVNARKNAEVLYGFSEIHGKEK